MENEEVMLTQLQTTAATHKALIDSLIKMSTDHEVRLRWVERVIGYGMGGAGLAYFLFDKFLSRVI